jgi:hypothetical protein
VSAIALNSYYYLLSFFVLFFFNYLFVNYSQHRPKYTIDEALAEIILAAESLELSALELEVIKISTDLNI